MHLSLSQVRLAVSAADTTAAAAAAAVVKTSLNSSVSSHLQQSLRYTMYFIIY